MRRPQRHRNIWAIVTLISGACLAGAIYMGNLKPAPPLQLALAIVGLTGTIFGVCFTLMSHVELIRYNRLIRGENFLARWTIDPATWLAFHKLNNRLNQEQNYHSPGVITGDDKPRNTHVDVIFTTESFMVDDDFHSLPRGGVAAINGPYWIDGPPGCIEFRCWTSGKSGTHRWTLRIPVAADAMDKARIVCEHFARRFPPPKPRNFRLIRNIAFVVGVACTAAFGVAYWITRTMPDLRQQYDIALMVTMIAGIIVGAAGLLLAMIAHLSMPRSK